MPCFILVLRVRLDCINTTKNKMQTIDQNEYLIDAEKGYIPSSKNQYYAQDFHYTKQDGKNALYTGEMDIKQNFLDESIRDSYKVT